MNNRNDEMFFIKILKHNAQNLIEEIKKKFPKRKIFNDKYENLDEKTHILFPLKVSQEEIDNLINSINKPLDFNIVERKPIKKKDYKSKTIEEALFGEIPKQYYNLIPKSYDIIGDIAIIDFGNYEKAINIKDIKKRISYAILEVNKSVKSVYEKVGKISGDYRIRKLRFLTGVKKTETIHKENNCKFKVDIKKTFFTPRLINERRKVSNSNIDHDEIIIDLFAGVGPFSIQIAKLHKVKIYAFDKNPYAYKYLKENIKLNELKGNIIPKNINVKNLTDSKDNISLKLKNKADRIIMNLPESSLDFLDVACYLIKQEGALIHNYQFTEKPNSIKKALKDFEEKLLNMNYQIEKIRRSEIVKSYSPKSNMIAIEALIIKKNDL